MDLTMYVLGLQICFRQIPVKNSIQPCHRFSSAKVRVRFWTSETTGKSTQERRTQRGASMVQAKKRLLFARALGLAFQQRRSEIRLGGLFSTTSGFLWVFREEGLRRISDWGSISCCRVRVLVLLPVTFRLEVIQK